jgi:hypothetical protein
MAHEAFALSPISARAASPTDADFEAIREAFLETARGRWFLDEYARRNRNTDTAMVLEAVARIEHSLALQKEEQQRQALSEPPPAEAPSSEPPSNALPEAMAAVRAIVAVARESAASALAGPAFEEAMAPSRKCARVIREIAWGLRESGADGRICALLDSQVDAINTACDQVVASGLSDSVLHAFDQAARQIDDLMPSAATVEAEPIAAIHAVALDMAPEEAPGAAVDHELFEVAAVAEISLSEPALVDESEPAELAIGSIEADAASEPVATAHLTLVRDEPNIQSDIEPVAEIAPEPVIEVPLSTLGASLIANGVIAKPASPRGDPLAAIRRMTQAEKVAFFS